MTPNLRARSLDEHRMHCPTCLARWLAIGNRPHHCPYCGAVT